MTEIEQLDDGSVLVKVRLYGIEATILWSGSLAL